MSDHHRDPFTLTVHLLILLALIWIGASISTLASTSANAAVPDTAGDEHLERTLASLDRVLAVTRIPGRGLTAAAPGSPTRAEGGRPVEPGVDPRRSLPEIRTRLAPPRPVAAPATGRGVYFELAEAVSKESVDRQRKQLRNRLHNSGAEERDKARKSLLLMDRVAILRRFGRPDRIGLTQTGHQYWTYDFDRKHRMSLTMHEGYAISVN